MEEKKNWIGHVLRSEGLMKEVLEGGIDGKRGRGRPRIGMLDELKKTKEESYQKMKRKAENREEWRVSVP